MRRRLWEADFRPQPVCCNRRAHGPDKGAVRAPINDLPEIRELFAQFELLEVELKYTVGSGGGVAAEELIGRG
jgi:hypothetical protein